MIYDDFCIVDDWCRPDRDVVRASTCEHAERNQPFPFERGKDTKKKERKRNAPGVLDTLVAWSSRSDSDTVVTGDFGGVVDGK